MPLQRVDTALNPDQQLGRMAEVPRLRLFGVPELLDAGGQPLPFRTRKQLAVLVYLHFEARTHPVARDALVDLLWPDVSQDKGRHSLSQALSAIRSRLGAEATNGRIDAVGLAAPFGTDLDLLASGASELVDVTQPLKDLDKCAAPDFAHWVDSARERILRQARERLAAGVREARSRGDLALVHRRALMLHRVDPVNPHAVVALAERALLDGDAIGAMRLLRDYVRRVGEELGANPHPEITALLRRLERGEGPAIESSQLGQVVRPRREVFVGREQELATLEAWWQRGRETSCLTGLVTGVAGIGKSSLVRRFATSVAARTNPVFVVTCQEIGSGIPFAAVSDLMLAIARDPAASGTDPHWLAEASRVSPGLRALYPGIPEAPQAPAESVRLRVAEALVRMIEAVAERRPVLAVFDDVQHMDPASRDVLFLFTRRLEQLHVVLLGTLRTDEGDRGLSSETQAETLGWQERLELEPLGEAQLVELIQGLSREASAPDKSIRTTIASLAQGNPYHAEMLLADWRQHAGRSLAAAESAGDATAAAWVPPETLRLAVVRQYKGLSTDAQHVLHVLAVAQKALSTEEIAGLLRLELAQVERSVLELVERGFVRVEGGRFSFKNELHRAYVYYAMAADARRYYHARLAQLSWARRDENDFQWALEASHHFIRAGMERDAVAAAVAGAELALGRGAPHEASRALRAVLQAYPQGPQSRVHLLLAHAHLSGGDYPATLEALANWQADGTNPGQEALAAGLRADALHRGRLADDRTIMEAARKAAVLSERARADETLVRVLQIRAEAAYDVGDFTALAQVREAANEIAAQMEEPKSRALAGVTRGFSAFAMAELQTATKILADTAKLLERLGLYEDDRRVLNGLGICWTGLGVLGEAESAFRRAIAVAERLNNPVAMSNTWTNLASLYHDFGRFSDAVEASRLATRSLTPSTVRAAADLYVNLAILALDLGNLSEAESFCQQCERTAERSQLPYHAAVALLQRADINLARSTPELAWPAVEKAIALVRDRERMLVDLGQYERLKTHFLWATRGYDAVRQTVLQSATTRAYRIGDVLEIQGFSEWVRIVESDDAHIKGASALSAIEAAGMFGVLARLLSVGVRLSGVPAQGPNESSAQLVARLFPAPERVVIPQAVGLPAQAGEWLHSV